MLRRTPPVLMASMVLTCLILIFLGKGLVGPGGSFIGGMDVEGYFFWNAAFVQDTIRDGVIPLWNPYYYSGHPFLANPSAFICYPATLFYAILPLPWAFNLDTVLHLFTGGLGMYFLVRLMTGSIGAGIASSIVFSVNGYCIERLFAGHITLIHAMALIPWVFFFLEKALLKRRAEAFLLPGLILGVQILGGDPQVSFYTALFSSLYVFLRILVDLRTSGKAASLRTSASFLLYPLVAFCVSAVQIMPSIELRSLSERAENTFEFATFMSFSPGQFFSFLIPKAGSPAFSTNWEFGCYVGVLALIVALIGFLFYRNRNYVLCFSVVLAGALTFMLGKFTPIYELYYTYLPAISTFRVPARAVVILDFILSVFVGFGIHHIHTSGLNITQYTASMISLIMISLCGYIGTVVYQIPLDSREVFIAMLLVAVSAVLVSLSFLMKTRTPVICLLISALFGDLYLVYSGSVPLLNSNDLLQKLPYESVFEGDPSAYRVNVPGYGELYGLPARGMNFQYSTINGNTPIILGDYFDFIYTMADVDKPDVTRHTFSQELFTPEAAFSSRVLGLKYALVESPAGHTMLETKRYQPRALILRDFLFTPSYKEHLQALKDPDFDPQKTLLLEKSEESTVAGTIRHDAAGSDSVVIEHYSPNRIRLTASCPAGGMLLLSELYYPGWKAYVDEKPVPVCRADYLLRAIPLEPGSRAVSVVYRPASFFTGLVISTLTILALMVLPVLRRFLHRGELSRTG